ncbi:MAG TPA: DUF6531 domain-containing protein [Candidatus Binatia bacterium]|nr:DUF6531 domain-containing protein [Candidatus Binatia bacterium]
MLRRNDMRRYVAGALLLIFVGQSSGVALADTPLGSKGVDFAALLRPLVSAIVSSQALVTGSGDRYTAMHPPPPAMQAPGLAAPIGLRGLSTSLLGTAESMPVRPLVHHTPLPRRPMANYADRRRYARLVPKRYAILIPEHAARPIDLVRLRHAHFSERPRVLQGSSMGKSRQLGGGSHGVGRAALTASLTGILPWWTYQSRDIPGVGTAMVNVANLNFLFLERDVDIPAGELDLAFDRTYNSESGHDAQNDDGSTPSVYGNHWTNNLDVHLAWSSTGQNTGTVSVYTADGSRDDYACTINVSATCTSQTAGVYDLLGTTDVSGGTACELQWTLKSGESYLFNAPYAACGNGAGQYGRLLAIYGRNTSFWIQLAYSWSPDASNPENLAKIVATHEPDGAQLILNFGTIAGSNPAITELASVERPDGQYIYYYYTTAGALDELDKPGNDPVLPSGGSMPTQFLDGNPIATGNLPETYDIEQPGLMEVCGPRATISNIKTSGSPNNGACVDFDYSNHQLSDWYTRGVLNPTPNDNVTQTPIQSGPNTGFVQWDDTTFMSTVSTTCEGNTSGATFFSDAYGHETTWCYDASSRVFQTQANAVGLETEQAWDANNDLVSTTDPRGNETDIAYDTNGNVVEVSLPSQVTSQGTIRPTSLYDYDIHNNLLAYCDPANNTNNSWVPSQADNLCESRNTIYRRYTYNTVDSHEPYGCLTNEYTPRNYDRTVNYGGNCGNGLPISVNGATYVEADNHTRTPIQALTYNSNGTLATYKPGNPDNTAWQLNYTTNGMNRVRSVQDPDGVTSYQCDNLDGSVMYSETAWQNELDWS